MPMKLEYRNPVSNRMFLNLQVGHWINRFPLYPTGTRSSSVEGLPAGRLDLNTGDYTNAYNYYHYRTITKPQASGSATFLVDDFGGEHTLKVGFEVYRERLSFLRMQPGDLFYRDLDGAPAEVDVYNTPNTGVNTVRHLSGFVQDSWAVTDRLTLNVGARFDRYAMGWPEQSISPTHSDIWAPRLVEARNVLTWANVAPRVGAAFDLTGEGRSVVKLFAGRFYWNPSTTIVDDENPVGQAAARYVFLDRNGNRELDLGPSGGLADSPELGRRIGTLGGAGTVTVDRELTSAYGHEVSAHFEQQVADLSFRGSYVYKNARNLYGIVDLNRAFAYRIPYAYADRGADDIEGTADDQVLQLLDRPPDVPEDRRYVNPGRHGLPSPDGDYHSVEVALQRRFSGRWMFLTSFLHTWAEAPLQTTSSTSVRTAARFDFVDGTTYEWQANQVRFGRVATSYWNYKLVGRYVFPYAIGLTAAYRLQSGFQVGRQINVPLPNAGTERVMANPYDDRAPNVGILDLRAEKSLGFRRGVGVTLLLDVFNVLNDAAVLNFRTISGPRYNEIAAILNPRVVRAGVRLKF